MYRGGLSLRTLRILIDRLPRESWTKTELLAAVPEDELRRAAESGDHRPDRAPWSGVELLLADVKDQIVMLRSVAIAAAGGKPPEFTPTPRPGIPPKSSGRRQLSDDQRRALDPRMRPPQEA